MAENSLNELLFLVKQQTNLQEKLEHQLIKLVISKNEPNIKIKDMTELLQHLPLEKQEELKEIITIICKNIEVGMSILFGSYARWDWIEEYEDDGIHLKYQSDFDLLVIVSETCKFYDQKKLERSIFKAIYDLPIIRTPVSTIVHDINFINSHLKKAQYFFSDIKKEGLILHDSGKFKLEEPIELDNKQRYQLAKEDFEYRIESAQAFFKHYKISFSDNDFKRAAFMLHQATENLYTCILLVFTRYKPKTHKLDELRKLINPLDKSLIKIFPLTTQEEIDRFTLLCEAYVEARYKKNYTITQDELRWLAEKVQQLNHLTEKLCQEKINSFLKAATAENNNKSEKEEKDK